MQQLIFTATKSEAISIASRIPMALPCTGLGHVTDAIAHLKSGNTVCAPLAMLATGWNAPDGTVVLFTVEAVQRGQFGELAQACERSRSRFYRPKAD